jgi:hypothetical protein
MEHERNVGPLQEDLPRRWYLRLWAKCVPVEETASAKALGWYFQKR